MKDNDELLEKLKLNIALSNFKEEQKNITNAKNTLNSNKVWRYYMKRKIIAISLACFIMISGGVAFAFNSDKIITYFRGLGKGIDNATENGYIQDVDMERIQEEVTVQNNIIENINVGTKVDDFVMDDYNLSVKFSFQFEDPIQEVIDLDNLHNIELDDLYILDENNVLIYNMLNENDFNIMCNENNLNFKWGEFNENYLNNGLNSFIANASKELNLVELQYNMYTDKYPKSKELNFYFTKITFIENDKEEKTTLIGDWHINLSVPEKFYNRTEEYYEVVSCTNANFNVYTAKVTDTGFEFGMTIENEIEPEYPSIITEKRKEITEKYGVLDEQGLYTNESQQIISEKMIELQTTSPYKELLEEYKEKNNPILSGGMVIEYSPDTENNGCYVVNSNGEKFGCTMSPSRRCNYEFINDNKYNFYETYSMTKYDASDTITMIVNYRGNIEYIKLSKIK